MVSKARDDLPEPLSPVITTSLSRGMSSVRFFRLCSRAPPIRMNSLLMAASFVFESNGKITQNDDKCKADANEGTLDRDAARQNAIEVGPVVQRWDRVVEQRRHVEH